MKTIKINPYLNRNINIGMQYDHKYTKVMFVGYTRDTDTNVVYVILDTKKMVLLTSDLSFLVEDNFTETAGTHEAQLMEYDNDKNLVKMSPKFNLIVKSSLDPNGSTEVHDPDLELAYDELYKEYVTIKNAYESGELKGEKGDKGDKGDDYVITESDYQAIADKVDDRIDAKRTEALKEIDADKLASLTAIETAATTDIAALEAQKTTIIKDLDSEEATLEGKLNTLSASLTNTFNANAVTKENTFNSNASVKTDAYNNNATEKTATFDADVTQAKSDISKSVTQASTSATNAATSESNALKYENETKAVRDSIPSDYSTLSANVDKLMDESDYLEIDTTSHAIVIKGVE